MEDPEKFLELETKTTQARDNLIRVARELAVRGDIKSIARNRFPHGTELVQWVLEKKHMPLEETDSDDLENAVRFQIADELDAAFQLLECRFPEMVEYYEAKKTLAEFLEPNPLGD